MSTLPAHIPVVVIGAGFAGLCTAIKLKESGREEFVVLERGGDVGGTWYFNTYPGAACDVPSHVYSFSFAPNTEWTRSFGPQGEILEYLRGVARDRGLYEHCRFGVTVTGAQWHPDRQIWEVTTDAGSLTCDVLVAGTGGLSEPSYPDLKGLSAFEGTTFHSARWDHSWSPEGRKVVVVGTGASAIQFVPQVQPRAAQVTVLQRTAPWVLPRTDRAISPVERALYRRVPTLQRIVRTLIYLGRESHLIGFRFHRGLLHLGQRIATKHLARQVTDPELRAKVTPHFDLGCKRVLLSNDWYPALSAPNVALVTDPLVEVVADGVVTQAPDGTRTTHEADTLIFGTGFSVTEPPVAEHLHNGTETLSTLWRREGMQAHRGLTIAGFPNLFLLVGPNSGLGHNSIVLMIEAQVGHLVRLLDLLDAQGCDIVEPRKEVQDAFNRRLQRQLAKTVWQTGGCASWYQDSHGRNTTLWPTFTWRYMQQMRQVHAAEYVLQRRVAAARAA